MAEVFKEKVFSAPQEIQMVDKIICVSRRRSKRALWGFWEWEWWRGAGSLCMLRIKYSSRHTQ